MTKTRKALLVALPTVALVIVGGVGIAAATTPPPTAPLTEQELVTTTVRQQAPAYGDQVRLGEQDRLRLRDGTCDGTYDTLQNRDRLQEHDPIRLHDRVHDRPGGW
ncbi:hypothetical protein [Actinophytocola sp. NPDC049390]|uniref:hypothetical protein n=1 Tax=Actinophytocola sp. NPDC049390 TaxID=3363894 RepID=UPI0037989366